MGVGVRVCVCVLVCVFCVSERAASRARARAPDPKLAPSSPPPPKQHPSPPQTKTKNKQITGGRNGYGAKLANIFSTRFVVATADGRRGRRYEQVFSANMSARGEPLITACKATDNWTCITFSPDLGKFDMAQLEDDVVALMTKRVYDVAGVLGKGCKVRGVCVWGGGLCVCVCVRCVVCWGRGWGFGGVGGGRRRDARAPTTLPPHTHTPRPALSLPSSHHTPPTTTTAFTGLPQRRAAAGQGL